MCASFILQTDPKKLASKLNLKIPEALISPWNFTPLGYMKTHDAPIIFGNKNGDLEVKLMRFSLCPQWSKEYPYKPSSYNARMERPLTKLNVKTKKREIVHDPVTTLPMSQFIFEIPSWKDAFNRGQTCLVPMNWAIESCHFGLSKGNIIKVAQENEEPYLAVGIWSDWTHPETGEIFETFALITDDPDSFFFEQGHDRSLFLITEEIYSAWLFNRKLSPIERFKLLRDHRISLPWKSTPIRALKKVHSYTTSEIEQIKVWKK